MQNSSKISLQVVSLQEISDQKKTTNLMNERDNIQFQQQYF